ncbi:MAG: peptidoglycan-binding protein [Myxococcales bacterium]|nr:peptidoglycan-binding protein [Myxococcales bacterium]
MDALEYNKSRNYSADQIRIIQHVVGVHDDGRWGPNTVEGVRKWQAANGLTADGKVGPGTYQAIAAAHQSDAHTADAARVGKIDVVGAWTGQSSFGRISEDVDFCLKVGINRLDVIVNEHSKARAPMAFGTYTVSKIVNLCKAARDAGLEVNLMSWIMPHADYIDGAAAQLLPLLEATGAASLQWDAEEPWTLAQDPLPYEDAAQRIAKAFAKRPCPMGVNGIGFTPTEKFGPLAAVCDYLLPQCYATSTNEARPDRIVDSCVTRWRKTFGADKPYIIGLAGYRQDGIPGYTATTAMNTVLGEVRRLGFSKVVYWSLSQIQKSDEVTAVIESIRER